VRERHVNPDLEMLKENFVKTAELKRLKNIPVTVYISKKPRLFFYKGFFLKSIN